MRLSLPATLLVATLSSAAAFAPAAPNGWGCSKSVLYSAVEEVVDTAAVPEAVATPAAPRDTVVTPLSADEINARLSAQLGRLREKDASSRSLSKEDLDIVFEDDHIVVVNKPSGVLTVAGKVENPNLAQSVFDAVGCEMGNVNQMVVHRLGMDTSGLIVFAKTMEALRGMNTVFRTRKIEKEYEALVCGSVEKDEGIINLPIMRDYEFPPFVRISTPEHQAALADLTADQVDKKLLEQPKDSLTKYKVVAREEFEGNAVTRVSLTSISGRYHQLNVHCAAFGHPIVGDTTYGIGGDAVANGGLTEAERDAMAPNPSRASEEDQKAIAAAAKSVCVHAKSLKFRHPVTKEEVSLSTDSPF